MKLFARLLIVVLLSTCNCLVRAQSAVKVPDLTFTSIDVPGSAFTIPWGINTSGDIVGSYGQDSSHDDHGFLLRGQTYTYFDYPGENITVPTGINDSDLIVGYAGSGVVTGFVYDGVSFTPVKDGNNSATFSLGINNAGDIVGGAGTISATTGFEMHNGQFKGLFVPGNYVHVRGAKINNLGMIVGWTTGVTNDGFVCRNPNKCKIMDYPGAIQTALWGINDQGVKVGWYWSSNCQGCAFASKNGKFISFVFPGAAFTSALGINSSGQIVGAYTVDYQTCHGFVTSPVTDADFG